MARCQWIAALFLTIGCASAPATPPDPIAGSPPVQFQDLLVGLSFEFSDLTGPVPDVYRSSGPYEIIAMSPRRIELRGFDSRHLLPTTTVLEFHGERVWATVRIGERDFFTRIR